MKRANQQFIKAPKAIDYGWEENNGAIVPQWTTLEGAPLKVMKDHQCKCLKGCNTNRCTCKKNNIPCTEICSCIGCQNERDLIPTDDEETLIQISMKYRF